jgi:hypothetical protein
MYKAGYRKHRPRIILFLAVVVGICVVLALVAWLFRGGTTVENAPSVTRTVSNGDGPTKAFDEGIFSFKLPSDWVMSAKDAQQYTLHSTKKYQDNRTLNIYVDYVPPNFAINKLLPVQVQGDRLSPGTVSDDCRNFTGGNINGAQQAQSQPDTPAKWQGINFICDLANFNRNAVGTVRSAAQ